MKAACALASLALASAAPVTPSEPSDGINYGAIAQVVCGRASGTAFDIGEGRLITAAHVTGNGPCSIRGVPVETVREDGSNDIAELRGTITNQPLRIRCRDFRAGVYYRAVGFTSLMRMVLPLIGTPFRNYDNAGNGLRVMSGEVYPGMSGGPVMDSQGRVVGITVRRWPAQSRELNDTFVCERNA